MKKYKFPKPLSQNSFFPFRQWTFLCCVHNWHWTSALVFTTGPLGAAKNIQNLKFSIFNDKVTWCDLSDHWPRLWLNWAQSGRNHRGCCYWCNRSYPLPCCYGNHFSGGSSRHSPLLCMNDLGSGCACRLDKTVKPWAEFIATTPSISCSGCQNITFHPVNE